MRLTRQSNYAIRTLVYCAVNAPDLSRIADIAQAHLGVVDRSRSELGAR